MPLAVCVAQVTVFLVVLVLTRIAVPFWDMLSFVDDYLTYRQTGNFLGYLLLPDNEHHSIWSRLLTIVDIEFFDGNGPSFQLFGLSCLLGGLMAFCFEIRHSCLPAPLRKDMLAMTCMLFLTVPTAVDCAVPMNGGDVQATGFVLVSLVLLDGREKGGRHALVRRATAVIAAMAASFGNAVGLLRGRSFCGRHGGVASTGSGKRALPHLGPALWQSISSTSWPLWRPPVMALSNPSICSKWRTTSSPMPACRGPGCQYWRQ